MRQTKRLHEYTNKSHMCNCVTYQHELLCNHTIRFCSCNCVIAQNQWRQRRTMEENMVQRWRRSRAREERQQQHSRDEGSTTTTMCKGDVGGSIGNAREDEEM